ncbi:hypothetical protein MLD38_025170 [Melastoma candidum]|uniref:Uncharacterized protein n=1 Tax=Melastoma candidum TaxID=119954 RepID=A0ACB9NVH7_9MYRT|nr:hypothetical protein MLD38_025170 [Melastoma candidum]
MGGDLHGHLPDSSSFCLYEGSYGETTIDPDDLVSEASALLRDSGSKEVRDEQFGINGKLEVSEDILEENGSITAAFHGYDEESRMRQGAYREVLKCYDNLRVNDETIALAREKILGYYPGAWLEEVGGMKLHDYQIPKSTCLLLIGPKGSGKSSLINRVSKVLEEDKFAPDRAQVSYNSAGEGTYFLQEYMVPRGSTSLCLYDTRGLSSSFPENTKIMKRWMLGGVCHGEVVIRDSDDSDLRSRIKYRAHGKSKISSVKRMVNYVIFVVNGLAVLKSMNKNLDPLYSELVSAAYKCPFLSFKDDKPAVVITHGDLLSIGERARVRIYLGELLGVHPAKQIFDIPDTDDPATALATVDMLRYCLEHADRNLLLETTSKKVWKIHASTWMYISAMVVIAVIFACLKRAHHPPHPHHQHIRIDWPRIRHLWLG